LQNHQLLSLLPVIHEGGPDVVQAVGTQPAFPKASSPSAACSAPSPVEIPVATTVGWELPSAPQGVSSGWLGKVGAPVGGSAIDAATVVGGLSAAEQVPFWLRLEGTAVHVEAEASCWLPGSLQGVVVGRNHQPRLHQEALKDGVLQYVSREHFRVDFAPGPGGYRVEALGSNPVWLRHSRDMTQAQLRKGQPPLALHDGDSVLLFTGASDNTPDGPGCSGTLYWTFHQQLVASPADAPTESITTSNAMGAGGELFANEMFAAAATRSEGGGSHAMANGIDDTQPVPVLSGGGAEGPFLPPQSYVLASGGQFDESGAPRLAAQSQVQAPSFGH